MLCGHPEPDKRMQGRSAVYKHPMSDARIGSEVAGYRIVSVLGQGGMGTVYLAEQTSPRRNVVVKLLRPDLSRDEAFRQRFVHESEAAASTEHPNIVPIYSAGEADGVLYIAMRYVEGDDLRHLISNRGPLPPDRAIEIVSQIASALDAAHARGLVHRDVKPGNILLDEGGNAYLSDFGLIKRSTVDTGLTETGQFMGSIEYCAPEQIRGDEVDGRADVYSLACVLYESIAGRPPFQRDTEVATLYAHLEQDPPRLASDGSGPVRELDPVVAKAMAKRPSDRYASAGEFARAARHAVGVTSGERQAAVPRSPRRRILLVAGAVAAALAVAGLALALSSGDDGTPSSGPAATGSLTNVVQRIDPVTGEVMQSIGGINQKAENLRVSGFAAGEGGLWVTNFANLQHVDPVSGTVRANVPIQSPFLTPVVAFRTVWIATDDAVERVNPATDELLRPIRLEQVSGIAIPPYIAAGEGAVWVVLDKVLSQIDPATKRDRARNDPRAGFDRDRRGGGRRLGDRQADGIADRHRPGDGGGSSLGGSARQPGRRGRRRGIGLGPRPGGGNRVRRRSADPDRGRDGAGGRRGAEPRLRGGRRVARRRPCDHLVADRPRDQGADHVPDGRAGRRRGRRPGHRDVVGPDLGLG